MKIDLRIELDDNAIVAAKSVASGLHGQELTDEALEKSIVRTVLLSTASAESVVVLRNDGFARLVPDESTRQERGKPRQFDSIEEERADWLHNHAGEKMPDHLKPGRKES